MLYACVLEFQQSCLVEFSYNNTYYVNIQMALYEALYVRKCRSLRCWCNISDAQMLGLEMIHETIEKVQVIGEKLKATQDRQKSYADLRRKPIPYDVGDKVILKVSPIKGVMRSGQT